MTEAEKAYQYFVIAVPESEEQAKAYFWARKALQSTLTQPNEPLTLEELREMDEEPVYVVPKDKPAHCGGWCGVTVWKCDRYSYVSLLRDADSGWGFEEYGKTWIAYRRPPEGEEDT